MQYNWLKVNQKTECKPANIDDVPDVDRLFIAKDSPAHQHFEMQPECNRP